MLKAETQNRLFLVMEYCANGSLTDAVKRPEGYNRKRDFLRHVEQITSTLAWLHEQGIVHRDIKPSNVLLDDEGNAKLCDLGLSRFQPGIGPGASPSVGFTSATMTVGAGSAPYMPPEGLADTEPGPQGGEEVRQRFSSPRFVDSQRAVQRPWSLPNRRARIPRNAAQALNRSARSPAALAGDCEQDVGC